MDFIEDIEDLRCRCCLNATNEVDNIFDCSHNEVELVQILSEITPIVFSQDDGFPQFICETCKSAAIEAFCFRQTCLATDERLRDTNHVDEPEKLNEIEAQSNTNEIPEETFDQTEEEIDLVVISCPFCVETYESTSELYAHVENSHKESNYLQDDDDEEEDEPETKKSSFKNLQVQNSSNSSKKYECFVCSKRFETPSKVKRHLYVHRDVIDSSEIPKRLVKEFKYECEICSKRLETPSKLQRHLRIHDKQTCSGINLHRPIQCTECNLRFWDIVKLERHRVIHSEAFERSKIDHPEGFMFTCVICLQKLPSYDECIDHMKNHREDGDENPERACQLCTKVYPKLASLIRHSRSHEENATHQCIHCGKRLGMGDDLLEHLLRHQGFKPFLCEFPNCGKTFLKSSKLKEHMSTHQENPSKDYICGHCDKRFAELDYLKRHLIRHSGRKDHKCQVCGAAFTFKSGLTSHMSSHSDEKPFACNVCSSKFSKKQALKTHQKIHTGEKKFACDQCSMKFITTGLLQRHKLTHSGFKPFQCNHCGKSYSQSNDLIKHLRTHFGPNVYKCDVADCQETFAKFSELKTHKASHYSAVEEMTEESYDVTSISSIKFV